MNKNLLIIIGCAVFGVWYFFIDGSKASEKHVYQIYNDYMTALSEADDEKMCDLFSDNVSGRFSTTSKVPINESMTKATVCGSVADFHRMKQKMEQVSGEKLYMNLEYDVNSITISPDKKTATVDVLIETRIGTEKKTLLDMRSLQTDVIKRNLGKAQIVQSDGTVSFY